MKMLVTLILAGSILCLAAVIGAVNRSDAIKVEGRRPLIGVAEALAVEKITLQGGDQRVVMVKRGENFWMFEEPSKDIMDPVALRNLQSKMGNLTILETLGKKELKRPEMALSNLGLDKQQELIVRLEINGKNNKKIKKVFSIGSSAPKANSVYIRNGGKSDSPICVVDGNLLSILASPFANLRERRLVTLPPSALVQVTVKSSQTEFTLQRELTSEKVGAWQLSKPVLSKADQFIVGGMLDDVLNLQITGDVYDGEIKVPETIPEGAYLFQFWHIGGRAPVQLYLEPGDSQGSDVDVYSAVVSNRPNQIFTHASRIATLLPRSPDRVRERRLGKVATGALDSIAIVPNDIILKSDQKANLTDWKVLFNDRFVPADRQKVNSLIAAMNEPVIIGFVDNANPNDYNMGMVRLGFNYVIPPSQNPNINATAPEQITRTLEFGFTANEKGERRMFASYVNEAQIFELDEGFAALLPIEVVKWRSPRVIQFSHFHVVSLDRVISDSIRGGETLKISFDSAREITGVDANGSDVPLDPGSVTQLRKQLASLKASEWVYNSADALRLLKKPNAVFVLNVREQDPATGNIIVKGYELKFVEGSNGAIFGQFDGAEDVFTIDPAFFRKLIQPLNR